MKPGERYMAMRDDQEMEDAIEGRLYRPEHWPADYVPAPGSCDDMGQRRRFGYLGRDGMWMTMPSPGTHDEAGISEFWLSQQPPSKCGAPFCQYRGCQGYCETAFPEDRSVFPPRVERKRPWWRFW